LEPVANFAPEDVEERFSVSGVALVVGFPFASSRVVVNPLVAALLAVAVKAFEVMTSATGGPAVMLSTWVPEVRVPEAAVMVGDPVLVSP
jgi:hypothetical protein